MVDEARYKKLLGSHIGFVERSAKLYDAGYEDEALRLATSMRVILHDTGNSTSLLTHLELTATSMRATARMRNDVLDYVGFEIDLASPEPITAKPRLDAKLIDMPLIRWWKEEVVLECHPSGTAPETGDTSDFSGSYTRRQIVLAVANKDGGAHVDAILPEHYKVLKAGQYGMGLTGNLTFDGPAPFPQGTTLYPSNGTYALIRQFAYELTSTCREFQWPIVRSSRHVAGPNTHRIVVGK
ncbi:hypothetical protein [Mycobacteroides abscessus]|uniref:hypothetical protein n=1 Tax=Mycobacteroides abscessus TaxID=36809 RepID=UPI00092CBCDD|nr:hypothetical protein [Mycobacteroides abscessus]MDO3312508.1 hypothetical protein [Mycobacteroides abscessus subsp. abscessus]MDO3344810.1 hypothetical protein [Mycobacteroides abscessus subsp. abscessus]SHP05560.1 Uncharacterised protein [Mycobacteroides abscessus subsp. abscessus]SHP20272.1 Uncharacterised protein [Mycobacteroides abscessus subsp. abscessus]SHP91206.1 Uncharacterised protein [Mycobacteroides abscessus subsp. abscessus]